MTSSKHNSGFTLIETLAFIAIGVAVLTGVYGVVNMTLRAVRTNALNDELRTLVAAMSDKYAPAVKTVTAPYATAAIVDVQLALSEYAHLANSTVTLTTPFATPLTIASANLFGSVGDSYVVQAVVPVRVCQDVVNQAASQFEGIATGTASNFVQAPAGTTATMPSGVTPGKTPTPTQVGTACGSGAGNISVFFYKV